MPSSLVMEDGIVIESVSKRFGDTLAVDDVSLSVGRGEFVSLLGPSGCGKTTLLRLIAGFENPDSGRILFKGVDATRLSPQKRPSAMVFQNYALFPHMSIRENVAYGLKVRKWKKQQIRERVDVALEQVDLTGLGEKKVTQLSGGQQQRVALARAVAVQPEVILFDEPLSNLDVALRERTRNELRLLQQKIGMTSIYVTHDQEEALSLSDRIAVMRDGRVLEIGSPEELYRKPESAFVASFLGGANVIPHGVLAKKLAPDMAVGQAVALRADDIKWDPDGPFRAQVVASFFHGGYREVWLQFEGQQLRAHIDPEVELKDGLSFRVDRITIVNNQESTGAVL